MRLAMLVSERALRTRLVGCIEDPALVVSEYPTADKALPALTSEPFDLVVLHWKVHPGMYAEDKRIGELATLIPLSEFNRNAFYWEVGLRVIDLMREEESPNRTTPVIVIFPDLPPAGYGIGDELARDAVAADVAVRQPADAIYGFSVPAFREALARLLPSG